MRIYGRTDAGATTFEIPSDVKRMAAFTMPEPLLLSKISAYIDGLGAGVGSVGPQALRALLYDALGTLLAQSDEVIVQAGQAAGWVDFRFAKLRGRLLVPQGPIGLAIHGGGIFSNVARVYGSDPHGNGGKFNNDTYSDGASAAFGAATSVTADMSIFLTASKRYADMVPRETDFYLARLPWKQSQAVLAVAGALPRSQVVTQLGWHSTFLDPETGANAIVRAGGPFEALLGERLKITTKGVALPRVAYVYAHDVADADVLPWDLSVTRLAFSQLAMLATDALSVTVEVVA